MYTIYVYQILKKYNSYFIDNIKNTSNNHFKVYISLYTKHKYS